jgi:hypothetical protein
VRPTIYFFLGGIINNLIAPLALSVLLLTACGSAAASPATKSPSASPTVDKYAQTWTKQYSQTTCADWEKSMTPAQQFSAAADILTSGRNKVDNGTGMPSDPLIKEFQTAVTDYCVIPSMKVTDATYAVYMDGKKYRP